MILSDRLTILAPLALNAVPNGGLFARLPGVQKTLGFGEQPSASGSLRSRWA